MLKPALNSVDTQFDALLQDLPVDLVASAREFQAFTRARKIKTPQELLRVVLLYCGLDQSLRTVAGNLICRAWVGCWPGIGSRSSMPRVWRHRGLTSPITGRTCASSW